MLIFTFIPNFIVIIKDAVERKSTFFDLVTEETLWFW